MSTPATNDPHPKSGGINRALESFGVFIGAFLLALVLSFVILPNYLHPTTTIAVAGANDALRDRVENLDTRLHILENHLQAPNSTETAATSSDAIKTADLAHVQSDLTTLSSAMVALQTEVKATGATANEARETSTALIASAVSFIGLRETAASGRPFADELAALRETSKNDASLLELATKLEPYALKGAPTFATLRDELLQQRPSVAVAIAKGSAQHWWQRILAELQGLITVRPLHGDEKDTLTVLESALTHNNATEALEAFKNLPTDAQKDLADWQKGLEARQQADDVLKNITHHFTGLAQVKTP